MECVRGRGKGRERKGKGAHDGEELPVEEKGGPGVAGEEGGEGGGGGHWWGLGGGVFFWKIGMGRRMGTGREEGGREMERDREGGMGMGRAEGGSMTS